MLFSIVVPSFNQGAFIARTLESIVSQAGDFSIEIFVEDGGSKDQTVSILQSFQSRFETSERIKFRWVSEPDKGQAHALNKGLAKVSGDVVAFLNSDDMYLPGAFDKVNAAFDANPESLWLAGRCRIVDSDDKEFHSFVSTYKNFLLKHYSYFWLLTENFICQPAVFWRKEMLARYGLFSEDQHYTLDYEYWLRIGRDNRPIIINDTLASFRRTRDTKSNTGFVQQFKDDLQLGVRYARASGTYAAIPFKYLSYAKILLAYSLMYRKR